MKHLLQQPLLHFLLLGILLFGLYDLVRQRQVEGRKEIVVTAQRIELLSSIWEKQWRRLPTPGELDGLIEGYVREEVLYREALGLGLDRDDTVVRRRLAQKIEMLARDLATQGEPGDEELRTFFEQNGETFEVPPQISFTHVYINTDRHGEDSLTVAEGLLAQLRAGAEPLELGDRFMLPLDFADMGPAQVARQFGSAFSQAAFELEPGAWQGPIESGYGLHLVFVHDRAAAYVPELQDIRDRVRNEFISIRSREADKAFYEALRERYEISIEAPTGDVE